MDFDMSDMALYGGVIAGAYTLLRTVAHVTLKHFYPRNLTQNIINADRASELSIRHHNADWDSEIAQIKGRYNSPLVKLLSNRLIGALGF